MTETATSRTTRKICIQAQHTEIDLSVGPDGFTLHVVQEAGNGPPVIIDMRDIPLGIAAQVRDFLSYALKDYKDSGAPRVSRNERKEDKV